MRQIIGKKKKKKKEKKKHFIKKIVVENDIQLHWQIFLIHNASFAFSRNLSSQNQKIASDSNDLSSTTDKSKEQSFDPFEIEMST